MKSMAAAGCVTTGIAVWLGAQAAMTPQAPPSDLPPVDYSLGPDSQPHPDVPKGTLTRQTLAPGKFFPGIDPNGQRRVVYNGGQIMRPAALTLTPDQAMLLVGDSMDRYQWSFQIAADGSLVNGEPFQRLEMQGGRLYRRETKRTGVVAWEPVKPPQPGL
jgi:hypothetical protein